MPEPGAKRGDQDRELNPLLARALSRLAEVIGKGTGKISQSEVARRSDGRLTQGHISKVLAGELPEVSFYVIAEIADAAGISLDFLVEAPRKAKRNHADAENPPDSEARPSDPGSAPPRAAAQK